MRCVLGLFEGVLTGAADGYARMADRTFGVEAFRATTADEFSRHLDAGLALQGPVVIEVAL